MPIKPHLSRSESGLTLIEALTFIVVVAIALTTLIKVFNDSVVNSVDPMLRIKALERGQAVMELIMSRKFDENTPTGGIPACDSSDGESCAGIVSDTDYDDVGDYHGFTDTTDSLYPVSVTVVEAGTELGITNSQARRVTLVVSMPDGNSLTLSSYKGNY